MVVGEGAGLLELDPPAWSGVGAVLVTVTSGPGWFDEQALSTRPSTATSSATAAVGRRRFDFSTTTTVGDAVDADERAAFISQQRNLFPGYAT